MRLLIVEDEAIIARDLATMVESFGHTVSGLVMSGPAALELAAEQRPDLVLMDIHLVGRLDGIAIAQQLQAQQPIPVVYLTAHADDATMRRAAATQPVGYLLKPFDERALWSMLEIAAHSLQQERRLQTSEAALRESNAQLVAALGVQVRRTDELSVLGELGRALTGCATLEEGYAVVARSAQQLFRDGAGTLSVLRQTPAILDPVMTWGSGPHLYEPLHPADCRVLHEERIRLSVEPCGGCGRCALPPALAHQDLCVPLSVEGETLGVLHLQLPVAGLATSDAAAHQQLILAFGEQVAIGLANVRLREMLHEQSIRDPLTGLFNRRYLEETLLRELHRATRDHYPVGVIMLDVDHFKQINDRYGHEAGDTVLRAMGTLLLGMVRAGDMACRYGGEEFALILPSAPLAVLTERAEVIRQEVSAQVILHHAQELPQITVSLGVSVEVNAEISVAAALAHADAALYAAKRAGRNRVVIRP